MERSGRIVTSAALIVVVVAGSFAFADIVLIKALGIGMAIAVALDATVIRALLVPATMRLLGRWNWWMPASLERFVAGRLPASEAEVEAAHPMTIAGEQPTSLAPRARRPLRSRCVLVVAAAGRLHAGAPILANPTSAPRRRSHGPRRRSPSPTRSPSCLPRDDGPHDRLTEWWYYTGHLHAADGARFGFEFVIFRAERGRSRPRGSRTSRSPTRPATGSSTASGCEVGPQVDRSPLGPDGAADRVRPVADRRRPVATRRRRARPAWSMAGVGRRRTISFADAGNATRPRPPAPRRARPGPALDRDQAAGPPRRRRLDRLRAGRRLVLLLPDGDDGERLADPRRPDARRSTASAWFDHQWGDFISVGGGGWDWFAVNLDDGTDLTLSLVRDADGTYPLIYGTVVAPDGPSGTSTGMPSPSTSPTTGRSPTTGADYPAGWTSGSRARTSTSTCADRRRPGARHAADDRRRLLGGLAGRDSNTRRPVPWPDRRMSSSPATHPVPPQLADRSAVVPQPAILPP